MKIKPILITAASILMLASITLFVGCKSDKARNEEIIQFLYEFKTLINTGNVEKLNTLFEEKLDPKTIKGLIGLLTGKIDIIDKMLPATNLVLSIQLSKITVLNDSLILANLPAEFRNQAFKKTHSSITLKICRVHAKKYKIAQIDAQNLMRTYGKLTPKIKTKNPSDTSLFKPITLAAFKTAAQLKSKYDTVLWFAYINNKTYYYVLNGKWDIKKDLNHAVYKKYYKDSELDNYKMGLVGPDLKEIIPVKYSLIHNIGGTFPNIIEVEKGKKRGFFDLNGREVVPVKYDGIYPIEDKTNLAVLKDGTNYYYLKKDLSITEKVDLKLADFFPKIIQIKAPYDVKDKAPNLVTEYNSPKKFGAIYLPPTYQVDLNLMEKEMDFQNPLRHKTIEKDLLFFFKNTRFSFDPITSNETKDNWFAAYFSAIQAFFLGGRTEFYNSQNLVLINKKNDKIYHTNALPKFNPLSIPVRNTSYNINEIRVLNDTVFEVKTNFTDQFELYDSSKCVAGGPSYNYYMIKNDELIKLPNDRTFGFTKYIKMDDSYLKGCYDMIVGNDDQDKKKIKTIDTICPEMLRYMKNEIYADYQYNFPDKRWKLLFEHMGNPYGLKHNKPYNVTVIDSLTDVDKYNLNFIDKKLKEINTNNKTLANK